MYKDIDIAVVIPCFNESTTIKKVISDFKRELPGGRVIVVDNNSKDDSERLAVESGASVIREKRQGKGWVIRSVFEKVDADIYIIVDGDDTYPAEDVHKLIGPVLRDEADMTVGIRLQKVSKKAFRRGHWIANLCITKTLNFLFKADLKDILSGYRVINRQLAKNVPLITNGFEIETELSLQSLENGYKIKEIPISYRSRPEGSSSKLDSFRDGYRIMLVTAMLLRDHQPLRLFTFLFLITFLASLFFIFKRFALGAHLFLLSFIFLVTGLVLSSVETHFKETISIIQKNIHRGGR